MPEEQNNQEEQQEQNNNQEQQVTQSPITSEDPVVTQSDLKRFYEAIKPYLNTVSIPNLDIGGNEEPVNAVITLLNNGNEVTQEPALNFKDFDISDDSKNERTDIKPHRLSNTELQELSSDLPPAVNRINNYSTEEQVVGTWIDGKPVYQKTFIKTLGSTSSNTWEDVDDLPNVDTVVGYFGSAGESNFTLGANFFANPSVDTSTNKLRIFHLNMQNKVINITVQYTKTTD